MADWLMLLGVVVVGIVCVILGIAALFQAFYVKVNQGTALIVNDMGTKPRVCFTGAMVIPVIHRKEFMKICIFLKCIV